MMNHQARRRNRVWRVGSWLLGMLLLAGIAGAREGGHSGGGVDPEVVYDMLAFESQEHFDSFMELMIFEQERADEGDLEVDVFADYGELLEFESLASWIEVQDKLLDEDEHGGFTDDNDPDDHHVPDPYLRGVLNPQGEILVGATIYRITAGGVYQIAERDFAALDEIRDKGVSESRNVTFNPYLDPSDPAFKKGECCFKSESTTEYTEYANGSRRMKAKQWVGNWVLYHSIGARTRNYRKKSNGKWKRERADLIQVWGSYRWAEGRCGGIPNGDQVFHKSKTNKKKVAHVNPWVNVATTVYVEDYFDSTHIAKDNDDTAVDILSMCECREASVSFELPWTSDDPSSVILDGSASENEDRYFVEIYETTSPGTSNVVSGYYSDWFGGEVPANLNLASLYTFQGGKVYRVKIAVQNGCTIWDEQVRWIRIQGGRAGVTYRAHVKSHGWLGWVHNGATAGTTGQGRRMEAAQIKLTNPPSGMGICYKAHVKGNGWLGTACNGATAGTTGQSRRMEAIQIWLTGAPSGCSVEYRAHVRGQGWLGWVQNGATAGTTGQSRRMEALQVRLTGSGCP
ncbi:MAG: hypothetical protein AAGD06_05175 [Acidobacteriota bacterium]